MLVFGAETSGLPDEILAEFAPEARLGLPMRPGNRSLNLSNAVAVAVYEALSEDSTLNIARNGQNDLRSTGGQDRRH